MNKNDLITHDEIDVAIYAEFVAKDFDRALQLYKKNNFYIGSIIHGLHFNKYVSLDLLYDNFLYAVKHNNNNNTPILLHHYAFMCMKNKNSCVLIDSDINLFKACHYEIYDNDFDKAKEYYIMEIENGHYKTLAMIFIGNAYYYQENNKNKSLEYYSLAALSGNDRAKHNYGCVLYETKKNSDIVKTIKCNWPLFPLLLGYIYMDEKNYDLAEVYFQKAIDNGLSGGLYSMGLLYYRKENIPIAINYFKKGSMFLNKGAIEMLGYIYEIKEHNIELSKEYYTLGVKWRKSTYSMRRLGYWLPLTQIYIKRITDWLYKIISK